MTSTDARAAEALRGLCGGAVRLPGDAATTTRGCPGTCRSTSARRRRLPGLPGRGGRGGPGGGCGRPAVVPLGTGHGAAALADDIRGAVLLRTSAMTGITIDAQRASARVAAGVQWGDLVDRAAPDGLTGRHMSSPTSGSSAPAWVGGSAGSPARTACRAAR
jgi:FAD/FMN-containing dehydrogenase